MWTIKDTASKDQEWAVGFGVFLILALVMDKTLGAAYYFCEDRILHENYDVKSERAIFQELVNLIQKELFDRCKEIFHWKWKTRKGGREACNPIRDGMDAFKGRCLDPSIARLVWDLQRIVSEFGECLPSESSALRLTISRSRSPIPQIFQAGFCFRIHRCWSTSLHIS